MNSPTSSAGSVDGRRLRTAQIASSAAQVAGLAGLAGVLVFRALQGGADASTIVLVALALAAVGPAVASVVVSRVRSTRSVIAKARPGSRAMAGYATADLAEALAGYGVDLPGAGSGRALVVLVVWPDGIELVAANQVRLLVVPWTEVATLTVGRAMVGFRPSPTVQLDLINGARLAVLPAAGTWWTTLVPSQAVATRLVQRLESLRRKATTEPSHG
ncbi:hypothetical protein [Pengzhenrongella phosphoraccumulans]|uniref:hypothetical protein n=1 Tax=Pengzhenrongella phosphoraccumulans TaxID=3114394 RepID=UPI003890560D